MRFGRRKERSEEGVTDEGAAPSEDAPDPSTWALPADAAVAAGGDVAEPERDTQESDAVAPEPQTAAGMSAVSVTSPGIGLTSEPAAAAAAAQPPPRAQEPPASYASAAEPGAGTATMSFGGHRRPEVLIAGAFVGAFLAAKILKRLSD